MSDAVHMLVSWLVALTLLFERFKCAKVDFNGNGKCVSVCVCVCVCVRACVRACVCVCVCVRARTREMCAQAFGKL